MPCCELTGTGKLQRVPVQLSNTNCSSMLIRLEMEANCQS
jgi:hypothetical protein